MSLLQRRLKKDLGIGEAVLYTVPTNKSAVLIGANVSNKIDTLIRINFILRSGADDIYVVKELPIPPNTAFSFSGLEQKLVLSAQDMVVVTSDKADSADVWVSFSEMEA